jgi:tetratricopeptide (TPR) repeat protein
MPEDFTPLMGPDSTQLGFLYEVWTWAQRNKRTLIVSALVVAVATLVISFNVWKQASGEAAANSELSNLRPTATAAGDVMPIPAGAFLKVVNDYPRTAAGARALLFAGATLFEDGKYAEAKTQFDRFVRDYPASPFRGEAIYGGAACLEALGRIPEAIATYESLAERRRPSPVVPRAKLALARLYQTQNQPELAYRLFDEVLRSEGMDSVGYRAEIGLDELKLSHSNLADARLTGLLPVIPTLQTNQP